MGNCLGLLTEPRSSSDRTLNSSFRRKRALSSTCWRRQCSSSSNMGNDINNVHSHSSGLAPAGKELVEGNLNHQPFVNEGAIIWHQMRGEWIGDRSQRPARRQKEPWIRAFTCRSILMLIKHFSIFLFRQFTTYDGLLATSQPFPQPIPLSEMVNFLVDIWQEEGLYG